MAMILSDIEIRKLLGSVIINGAEECIRPNSYIIRLGSKGAYISTGNEFSIGEDLKKKGIKLPSGYAVGVSSIEEIDFSKETVEKVLPGKALHGFLTPTTDLSREGVVVASTQIDAGFHGSLNWTLTNSSSQEKCYVYGEKLFRLTFFKLDADELPEKYYSGDYQGKMGYVRSQRKIPLGGMQECEWVEPNTEDEPEKVLDFLTKAGYPWRVVAVYLKTKSAEYQEIEKSIQAAKDNITEIHKEQKGMNRVINEAVNSEIGKMTNSVIVKLVVAFGVLAGLVLAVISNQAISTFIMNNGGIISIVLVALMMIGYFVFSHKKGKK